MVVGILLLFASNYTIYHATTVMDIVYICGYILPPKKVDFASLKLFSVLQLAEWLVETGK